MPTNFPKSGDDKQISLRNSEYPQFDYDYALDLREEYPDIWSRGGNIRGNSAFTNWGKARSGDITDAVADWIKEREAWAARHYRNNRLAGVVAQVKWGVIGTLGEGGMKGLINEQKRKENGRDLNEKGVLRGIFNYLKGYFQDVDRRIKDIDSWSGAASGWDSTEAYCRSCLINVNQQAGNEEPDTWTQENCKLPVREQGDSEDTYVRQAVYAAVGGRGITQVERPGDVSEDDWNTAVSAAANELMRAYEEMDEDPPDSLQQIARGVMLADLQSDAIRMAMEKYPGSFVNDFYLDESGDMFLILTQEGKLYRTQIDMSMGNVELGEWEMVEVSFNPRTKTTTRQMEDGQYRWLSISASSVLNRDGEIDSRDLFDSFVSHIEQTGEYPRREFYHLGEEFEIGQCDFVARDGNLLITSGYYHDTELARRAAQSQMSDPDYWGESIGYIAMGRSEAVEINSDGIKINVYRSGVLKEISMLPERSAANLFTQTRTEVKRMVSEQQREALLELFGGNEEEVDRWLADADLQNRAIEEDGLVTRSQDQEGEESEASEEVPTEVVVDDDVMDDLVSRTTRAVLESDFGENYRNLRSGFDKLVENLNEFNSQIVELKRRIEKLEASEEDKRREWSEDLPQRRQVVVTRPRVIRDTGEDEEKTAAEIAAEILSNKTGKEVL